MQLANHFAGQRFGDLDPDLSDRHTTPLPAWRQNQNNNNSLTLGEAIEDVVRCVRWKGRDIIGASGPGAWTRARIWPWWLRSVGPPGPDIQDWNCGGARDWEEDASPGGALGQFACGTAVAETAAAAGHPGRKPASGGPLKPW